MSTSFRFEPGAGQDNTFRTKKQDAKSLAYAATIALVCDADLTQVKVGTLTGALTMTANVGSSTTPPYVGDELQIMLLADATSRTVTFGTGFAASAALVLPISKRATASFVFDGAAWVETGRAIQA